MGIYKGLSSGESIPGLKVGDQVVTGGGTYIVTGINPDGSYQSSLADKKQTTYNYKGTYDPMPTSGGYDDEIRKQIEDLIASFNPESIPTYTQPDPFSFDQEKPVFENTYQEDIDEYLNTLDNWEDFSYDVNDDEMYAQYRKNFLREGDRSYRDSLAAAAANTGGVASSYANTAAAQSRSYQNAQLNNVIPQLYDQAYGRYQDEYNRTLGMLDEYQQQQGTEYGMHTGDLNQWNQDRNYEYGKYLEDKNFGYDKYREDQQKLLELIQTLGGINNL